MKTIYVLIIQVFLFWVNVLEIWKKSRVTCSCGLKCLLAFGFFPYYLKVDIILFLYLNIYLFSIPLVQTDEWFCRIRETVVHFPAPKYGNGFYFPPCAALNRCSGCCVMSNFDCIPLVVQQVEVEFYHVIPHGVFFFNAVVKFCFLLERELLHHLPD